MINDRAAGGTGYTVGHNPNLGGGSYKLSTDVVDVGGGLASISNIGFNPLIFGGLVFWVKADAGITLNVANVSGWADQSGTGNNLSQVTSSAQPLYDSDDAAFNNKASVYFDGGDRFRLNALGAYFSGNDPSWSVFIVVQDDHAVAFPTLLFGCEVADATTGAQFSIRQKMNTNNHACNQRDSAEVDANTTAGTSSTSPLLLEVVQNGQTCTIYTNGTSDGAATADRGASTLNYFEIGSVVDNFNLFTGKICEILIYSKTLSSGDRLSVENYLNAKYDLY